LPEKSGTYRFVNITYCIEDHSMNIDEYEVEYVE